MTGSLWQLEKVTLAGRPRDRLAGLTVEIEAGVTAVLGPSGAGKSSLLSLLVGFEQASAGRVTRCFADAIGGPALFWVPPDDGLWPQSSVLEHLELVARPSGGPGNTIEETLEIFDLSDKRACLPDQLSQGERSRLSMARAMASGAAVLVCDEPLSHVDAAAALRYWEAIRRLVAGAPGNSIIFATHSAETVLREARQVICLDGGRLAFSGEVERLYHDPPARELAWSLGPANWMGDSDAARWLDAPFDQRRCVRPEQLEVSPLSSSPLVVEASRFAGSIAELELRDERSGDRRKFYHRPAAGSLSRGQHVALRVVALLTVCLSLAGCAASESEPELSVRGVENWVMPAEGARVPAPRAVHATAQGDVYVLDNAGRVVAFDAKGHVTRQWWMPDHSVGKPEKICLLKDGRLVVADTHYHRLVFFDCDGRELARLGGHGHGPGEFVYPVAITQDGGENLYVCEYGDNHRVQKFTSNGTFVLQFGAFGTAAGEFQRPSGITWCEGRLYVADAFNNRIQVFSEEGEFLEVLGSSNDAVSLHYPYDIAAAERGDLYVVEYGAGRVSKLDRSGRLLGRFGTTGTDDGCFSTPWGLSVCGKSVYVADTGNRRVVELKL